MEEAHSLLIQLVKCFHIFGPKLDKVSDPGNSKAEVCRSSHLEVLRKKVLLKISSLEVFNFVEK